MTTSRYLGVAQSCMCSAAGRMVRMSQWALFRSCRGMPVSCIRCPSVLGVSALFNHMTPRRTTCVACLQVSPRCRRKVVGARSKVRGVKQKKACAKNIELRYAHSSDHCTVYRLCRATRTSMRIPGPGAEDSRGRSGTTCTDLRGGLVPWSVVLPTIIRLEAVIIPIVIVGMWMARDRPL